MQIDNAVLAKLEKLSHLKIDDSKKEEIMEGIVANTPMIRHAIAMRTKNQLRRMPEMKFLIDDSLDYIDNIDQALKGLEDPIKNPTNGMRKKK